MLTKVTLDYHGHHGAYLAKSVPIAPFDSAGAIALPCFLLVIAFLAEPLPTSLAPFGFGFAFAGVAAFGLGVAFGFAFSVAAAFGFDCVAPPPVRLPAQRFPEPCPQREALLIKESLLRPELRNTAARAQNRLGSPNATSSFFMPFTNVLRGVRNRAQIDHTVREGHPLAGR